MQYYYYNKFVCVVECTNPDDPRTYWRKRYGNYFLAREDASEALKQIKQLSVNSYSGHYYIDDGGDIVCAYPAKESSHDKQIRVSRGNSFSCKENARKAQQAIHEALMKFHEEKKG